MQSKTRNWTDVQLIISSISIALTLGFWGLIASREEAVAVAESEALLPVVSPSPVPTVDSLVPGQILYLSTAAPASPAPVTDQPRSRRRDGDGGGGGGADASTGSS